MAYAIGVAKPMNVTVYTEGTGVIPDDKIAALVNEHFDLRPKGIIQMLDLLRPIYAEDRGLRPLRPRGAGVQLGADGQGGMRCAQRPGCRPGNRAAVQPLCGAG